MSGERYYTTKIWQRLSSIGFSSAAALSTSMGPRGEPVISTWKRPCQKIQNGSEFPELVAQNFRNPHLPTCVPERTKKSNDSWGESVRLQAVNIELAEHGRSTGSGVVAAGADVDLTVGDGGNGELHGKARLIACDQGAVPEFWREFSCIKGVKHGRPAAWRLRSTVHARVYCPHDAVVCRAARRNGRCCPREAERDGRGCGFTCVEFPSGRIKRIALQWPPGRCDVQRVVPKD